MYFFPLRSPLNIKKKIASQGINDTSETSVIFHCVRFRVSGIIHDQLNRLMESVALSTSHTTRTCFFRDHSLSLECLCPWLSLPWPIYDSQVAFYQSPEPPCGGHLLANTLNLSLGHCSRLIHLFYQTDGPFFSPFDCLLEKLYFACCRLITFIYHWTQKHLSFLSVK